MGLVRDVHGVIMPSYRGDAATGKHVVSTAWQVSGVLPDGRKFTVRVFGGFSFDGASIPRTFWRLCGHPMEVPRVAAALAHDWLYAAHVCDRATADAIYAEICRMVGMASLRVTIEHAALRIFGCRAWKNHGESEQGFARSHGEFVLQTQRRKEIKV